MLGTFSFELYFKSYRWFTDYSLEFMEIANRSLSPSSSLLALCSTPPADSGVATAVVEQPGSHLLPTSFSTRHAQAPTALYSSRRSLHPRATRPENHRRPPPRRRRGQRGIEPTALSSRVHQHYKKPRNPFCSLFRRFPAPRPQNTACYRHKLT